jgi:hypothetical protein
MSAFKFTGIIPVAIDASWEEGWLAPSICLTLNVEWRDIERGQATLPNLLSGRLSYFVEA